MHTCTRAYRTCVRLTNAYQTDKQAGKLTHGENMPTLKVNERPALRFVIAQQRLVHRVDPLIEHVLTRAFTKHAHTSGRRAWFTAHTRTPVFA
jgi:hypothetical protein